jgi:lipoyl(octanoyl) transferase
MSSVNLEILDLGTISYQQALAIQKRAQEQLICDGISEKIFFCEHPPTLTYGASTELEQVLLKSEAQIRDSGLVLCQTDRGGNITYHGPGQLLIYPILKISLRKADVDWYLRTLEKIVIKTLLGFQVESLCIPSRTGIWTSPTQKICSLGVRFSRWCSMHGLSINLTKNSEQGFKLIHPCGILGVSASSIEACTGLAPDRQQVIKSLSDNLISSFYDEFKLRFKLELAK